MTTRDVQLVCLDILKDVHDFCKKNNIRYSLSGGTLLGAIRHDGFIPWDDDVDIQIPLPDYDRFIKTYKSNSGFELFAYEKEGCKDVKIWYARVCDMKRTYVEQGPLPWLDRETGVWIDVLPVYGAPSTVDGYKIFYKKFYYYKKVTMWWRTGKANLSDYRWMNGVSKRVNFFIRHFIGKCLPNYVLKHFLSFLRKIDYDSADYFCASIHYGMGEWQPKKYMEKFELHKFEDREFFVMSAYDENLKCLYGDYMTLPPVEKRVVHTTHRYYWK